MFTNKQNIKDCIAIVVGCPLNQVSTSDRELEYILGLEDPEHQELAMWMASEAVMRQLMKPEHTIKALEQEISKRANLINQRQTYKPSKFIRFLDDMPAKKATLGAQLGLADAQAKAQDQQAINSWLAEVTGVAGGLAGAAIYKPAPPPVENLAPKPVTVEAQPEYKGRKFRNE